MEHLTPEIEAFFAGDLTPEQLQSLEAWINADPANARAFMQELHFRELLGQRLRESKVDTRDVLAELARLEDQAHPDLIRIESAPTGRPNRWLWAAAAASLGFAALLAITLILTLGPATRPSTPGLTAVPPTPPGPTTPTAATVVATLTAEHNAVWDRRPGQDLYAGQRFTLTQGFAEVTTARGAVAILEAPATIELLDNDNAIRLHAGKLVGICETDASKGFIVRTAHMDLTDLGTRFGVDASDTDATEAVVFSGSIRLTPLRNNPGERSNTLTSGQHARIDNTSEHVTITQANAIHQYVHDWRALVYAPRVEGAAAYHRELPFRLDHNQFESETINVFLERSQIRLPRDLAVTVDRPGAYAVFHTQEATLPAQTHVDSYLIHLDIPGVPEDFKRYRCVITFDQPIVAVIATQQQMQQAQSVLGLEGVRYADDKTDLSKDIASSGTALDGLEQNPSASDIVNISEDRRQLMLDLSAGPGLDQFRVLVQSRSVPE